MKMIPRWIQKSSRVFVLGSLVLFISTVVASTAPQEWRAKMNELSKALSETIPFLYPDPGLDSKALAEKIKKIHTLSQELNKQAHHAKLSPDGDPALVFIAQRFNQEIEQAYKSIGEGHTEYAKGVIRSSVSYCIACHTRNSSGVEFPLLKAFNDPLKKASWIERIEFQAASRQFDAVWNEVMRNLNAPGLVQISSLDLERASRIALSLAVRVKQDPDRAALLAISVRDSKNSNPSMKERAKVWLKDIRLWQSERDLNLPSDKEKISFAQRLLKFNKDSDRSEHSEVKYLRVSLIMHDLIKSHPNSDLLADAYFLLGQSYDVLQDLGVWSLQEMYYLACIDRRPHSKLAKSCYEKYEDSITLGYSGSSGTHIPKMIRTHLNQLKEKASP